MTGNERKTEPVGLVRQNGRIVATGTADACTSSPEKGGTECRVSKSLQRAPLLPAFGLLPLHHDQHDQQQHGARHAEPAEDQPDERQHHQQDEQRGQHGQQGEEGAAHRGIVRMRTLDRARQRRAHCAQVLEITSKSAFGAHDSGASSCPNSVKVSMGEMGHSASVAARLISGFQHLAHPLPREIGNGGSSMLNQEPETMTTPKSAPAAASAPLAHTPRHYLKRLAFRLAHNAALRRAELRARAFGVIAADRLNRGGSL